MARLSEQIFRLDKWSVAGVRLPSGGAAYHRLRRSARRLFALAETSRCVNIAASRNCSCIKSRATSGPLRSAQPCSRNSHEAPRLEQSAMHAGDHPSPLLAKTESSNPTTISSTIAARRGTNSRISPGESCRLDYALGRTVLINGTWYNRRSIAIIKVHSLTVLGCVLGILPPDPLTEHDNSDGAKPLYMRSSGPDELSSPATLANQKLCGRAPPELGLRFYRVCGKMAKYAQNKIVEEFPRRGTRGRRVGWPRWRCVSGGRNWTICPL